MPNWCSNTLDISTIHPETLARFKEQARSDGTDLSFQSLFPTPQRLLETPHCAPPADPTERKQLSRLWASNMSEFGHADGYEWKLKRWGTQWDVSATLVESYQHYLSYTFDSAWSPPIAWLQHASACFSELHFFLDFVEPTAPFAGKASAVAGVVDVEPIKTELAW